MEEVPDTAQHFIECETKLCRNYSDFYCNTCHQKLCDLCREAHQQEIDNSHDVVSFLERKRKLPSEKCQVHIIEDLSVYCDDCQTPVCLLCVAKYHNGHEQSDLETVYNETLLQCKNKLTDIWKTVIPIVKDNLLSLSEKREHASKEIAKLRLLMKKRADEFKEAVDSIYVDNNKKLDQIKNSILDDLDKQQKKSEDYINELTNLNTDYERKISSMKPSEVTKFNAEISLATMNMPNPRPTSLPIFTPGILDKEEIAIQFGEIKKNSFEENIKKNAMKLSSSVTSVQSITVPELSEISHVTPMVSDKFWANDYNGNLIQSNMEGHILQKLKISSIGARCVHAVTMRGELLYTDIRKRTVYRVTSDMTSSNLIYTDDWKPVAIYSSLINGHILLGMLRDDIKKIARYSRKGKKLQDISDDESQTVPLGIFYITENINGDICTSDYCKVVVLTGSGKYRFSYPDQQSQFSFRPYGICTDVMGHILMCNGYFHNHSSCVHLLDKDGRFISFILSPVTCPRKPRALCIDDQHNLWLGSESSSSVNVYKYIQSTNK
ncbi:uncharacterized protein LOC133203491 [Saccostrea echinata]|uniref:uncharacterized protein LOC133203491 n=1 Tax=Saccostrea echinata TaxID=191078 RepID=UPI002A814192|nr:uncharacterized protein LOC133203491 [Saccostrea echinata]